MGPLGWLRYQTFRPRGDERLHLGRPELEAGLHSLSPPADAGELGLIVARVKPGVRHTPGEAMLTPEGGMPGDAWARSGLGSEQQLTMIRLDVARLIANGQPLWLFGDNLLVELDLSEPNLPPGSRLQAGEALLEVTPKPHTGCRKFRQRFGLDALALTLDPRFRPLRLRGIHLRVVAAGRLAVGAEVRVLERA
jgi:MOSC domain-containing protein YiiM